MAISNFLLTVVGVGAAIVILRGDVKRTAITVRRNMRQIRQWLEEEQQVSATQRSSEQHMKQVEKGDREGDQQKTPDKMP